MLFLEDLNEGREFELGSMEVTKEAMLQFSEQFDPQPFHIDESVGQKMFGGIIASGWHTASVGSRLMVDGFLKGAACMASPGLDEMKFIKPVYAGDVLTAKITVLESRVSKTKPDRGLCKINSEITNQKGEMVLSMIGNLIMGCRPTS
jgi:acyl dehydratase